MQKGTIALLGEIASLLHGAVSSGLRLVNNLVSMGFKAAFQYNESAMAFSRQAGLTHAQAQAYSEVLITRAKELGERYGIAAEEVSKLEQNLAKATGRIIMLNNIQAERQIQINRTVGEQTADEFSQIMMRTMGAQFSTVQGAVTKAYATAAKRGLDAAGMAAKVGQNLAMANRLTFRNGVDGLTRMVALSEKLGFNVQSIEAAANKFMDLQDSIENSAKLTMLGGAAGALGGNPLDMTYEANYDPEAFAERFTKILAGYAHFDERTGMSKMNALSRDFVKGIADAMGVSLDEAVGIAKKQAELTYKRNNFRSDINRLTGGDEAKTDLILNRSTYNPNTRRLEMTDRNGKAQDINYFFTDDSGKKQLAEMMRFNGMSDEEIVREQAQAVVSINDTLQGYVTTISGLIGSTIQDHMPQIKAFLGDLYRSIKPHIGTIANNIKGLVETLFTKENIETVKSAVETVAKFALAAGKFITKNWWLLTGALILGPLLSLVSWGFNTAISIMQLNALKSGGIPGGGARGGAGGAPGGVGGSLKNWLGTRRTLGAANTNFMQNFRDFRGQGTSWGKSVWYGANHSVNSMTNLGRIGLGAGISLGGTLLSGMADEKGIAHNGYAGGDAYMNVGGKMAQVAGLGLMFGLPGALVGAGIGALWGLYDNAKIRKRVLEQEAEREKLLQQSLEEAYGADTSTLRVDRPHKWGVNTPDVGGNAVINDSLKEVANGRWSLLHDKERVLTSEQAAQVNGFINTAMSTFVQPKPVGDVTYIYASNDGYSTGRGGKIDVSDITVNITFKDTLKLDAGLFSSEIDMNKLINNDRFQNAIAEAIFSRADFASKINDARNENIYGSKLRNSAWLAGTEAHNTFGRKNGYGN